MANKSAKLYVSHVTEDEKESPRYGDSQVLVCKSKRKVAKKMKPKKKGAKLS